MTDGKGIVVVSPYRTEYGPPQTLEYVCRALVDAGHRAVLVIPPGARVTPGLAALDLTMHELPGLTTFPRTLSPPRLGRFFRQHLTSAHEIEAIIDEERAAAVYSISEAIFAGSLAARNRGIPSLVHVIGMSIQSPRWGGRMYVRALDRLTTRFVPCSSAVAEMLASYGVQDEKMIVVHNGIPISAIDAAAELPSPELRPGPRIGMIAAYDPRKGHELFVESAALVLEAFPDASFYLIGGRLEGHPESAAFEQRIARLIASLSLEDRVVRTGYVPPPSVYALIRALDVVVVPSRTEAFAHALLEGMACGKAVVATGIEGNLDAFVNEHSGIYVESAPKEVAAAAIRLLGDDALRAHMGAAAQERVRRLFDLEVTLPALAQAVDSLLEDGA